MVKNSSCPTCLSPAEVEPGCAFLFQLSCYINHSSRSLHEVALSSVKRIIDGRREKKQAFGISSCWTSAPWREASLGTSHPPLRTADLENVIFETPEPIHRWLQETVPSAAGRTQFWCLDVGSSVPCSSPWKTDRQNANRGLQHPDTLKLPLFILCHHPDKITPKVTC